MIFFGLGTGRCGTTSLAALLDSQQDSVCFQEMNVSSICFKGTVRPILNTIDEFELILQGGDRTQVTIDWTEPRAVRTAKRLADVPSVRYIGDVAHYYLYYVDAMLEKYESTKFICLKRPRTATVQSWSAKVAIRRSWTEKVTATLASFLMHAPNHSSENRWQDHDGVMWRKNPKWDKCFPKFEGITLAETIGLYWDDYYRKSSAFEARYPENFRIFDISALNSRDGQNEILDFVGFAEKDRRFEVFHANKTSDL